MVLPNVTGRKKKKTALSFTVYGGKNMEKLQDNGPQLTGRESPAQVAATENEDAETKVLILHRGSSEQKNIPTPPRPLWPTPKQNYTNSMLSKYL